MAEVPEKNSGTCHVVKRVVDTISEVQQVIRHHVTYRVTLVLYSTFTNHKYHITRNISS